MEPGKFVPPSSRLLSPLLRSLPNEEITPRSRGESASSPLLLDIHSVALLEHEERVSGDEEEPHLVQRGTSLPSVLDSRDPSERVLLADMPCCCCFVVVHG